MGLKNGVRDRRLALGMTQVELSRLTGVSRQSIWAIERGEDYEPSLSVARAIAEALKTSPELLFWSEAVA